MLQQRQVNDIEQLIEISFAPGVNPGAITAGSTTGATISCVLGSPVSSNAAAFTTGDYLEVIPPAGAYPIGGLLIQAQPSGTTPGAVSITFQNTSAGTITPVSGTYTIVAKRYTPTVI